MKRLTVAVFALLMIWMLIPPPFQQVEATSYTPCWQSDSDVASLRKVERHGGGWKTVKGQGACNSDHTWARGDVIRFDFIEGCIKPSILFPMVGQSVNFDMQVGIYDVSPSALARVGGGPAPLVSILGFGSPFGNAPNGLIVNAVGAASEVAPNCRRPADAVTLQGVCPVERCAVGAVMTFFAGEITEVRYDYWLSGRSR